MLKAGRVSVWEDEKVLEVVVVIFAQQCKYLTPPTCTLEMVKTVISCYVSPFPCDPNPIKVPESED